MNKVVRRVEQAALVASFPKPITGNCNLWWLARRPVRPHLSQEQLLALNLNQAPAGTPDVITG